MTTPPDLPGAIGRRTWVIADGYIPPASTGEAPDFTSHDSFCMLNAGELSTEVRVWIYYSDQDPVGPYRLQIGARRAFHQRINDLTDPQPVPLGTDYCVVITSDEPIVVQHTRLDSRQAANALMSTIAYSS
jgi:hypothetical protein